MYYRREYIDMLDARHSAQSSDLPTYPDWDALVLAMHFELSPPPPKRMRIRSILVPKPNTAARITAA